LKGLNHYFATQVPCPWRWKKITGTNKNLLPGNVKMRCVYRSKNSMKMNVLRPCAHGDAYMPQYMMAMNHDCSSWLDVCCLFLYFCCCASLQDRVFSPVCILFFSRHCMVRDLVAGFIFLQMNLIFPFSR